MSVSRETERFAVYEQLLRKWSPAINLVAPADLDHLRGRHIDDCLQLVPQLGSGHLVDVGSGGGLPGLVIAAAVPDGSLRVTLMEADSRKASFLRAAVREMALPHVSIITDRIEAAPPQAADHVTARALAPLPRLLGFVHRHLRDGGTALLMKGAQWRSEVDAAREMWDFSFDPIPSSTDPSAAILHVTDLKPR